MESPEFILSKNKEDWSIYQNFYNLSMTYRFENSFLIYSIMNLDNLFLYL